MPVKSDWSILDRSIYRYEYCAEFMGAGRETDLGNSHEYYLVGPDGSSRIDDFYAQNLSGQSRLFTLDDTAYIIRERYLYRFVPESLLIRPMYPLDLGTEMPSLDISFHLWGDSGMTTNRSDFAETEDFPIAEFLDAATAGMRWNVQHDSVRYFDRTGAHFVDIASFFGFNYILVHDIDYRDGTYYAIFQNEEDQFILGVRYADGTTEAIRFPFPKGMGYVPNLHFFGGGIIGIYRRQSRATNRIKQFAYVDQSTRNILWKEAYWVNFYHGQPVYQTVCDINCN